MSKILLNWLILIVLIFIKIDLIAQKDSNIVDLSDKFQLHFYGKYKFTDINFHDDFRGNSLVYSPNDQVNLGVGFNWKHLGFGFAFNFKFINNDDLIYGDTKRLDLQINAYGNRAVVDLTFFYYESYYLVNPQDVLFGWKDGDANYIRPDISMASFGLSYIYVHNHKQFSYKAAFISNALQKKSAGSLFYGGMFNFATINSDSSFFPVSSTFGDYRQVNRIRMNAIGLNFGYAYNLILPHHFYIAGSMAATPSIGVISCRSERGLPNTQFKVGLGIVPRAAIGYNGLNYYVGISTSTLISGSPIHSIDFPDISWKNGNVRFFVGKRF